MATGLKITLIEDRSSPNGRTLVRLTGGIYENTPAGNVKRRGERWIITDDCEERSFPSALAAALQAAADYISVNESPDITPAANKISPAH